MRNLKGITGILFVSIFTLASCTAQKNNTANGERERGNKGERPTVEQIFEMDTNGDDKLSVEEIEGPLKRDFERVDADKDGFITREELENAPKPERRGGNGQRPPRQ